MTETGMPESSETDVQAVDELHRKYLELTRHMAGVIVGQEEVIEQLMTALLCRGHCILEGVPGLAKTLVVSTLAGLLNQSFRRIQFTPDLMPSDITGSDILEEDHTTGKRFFRFVQGPLFGNMILADEINRTPPKTQSALLEATQERQLTVGGQTYALPNPFLVLATQNPIEQEGTYPLPEAQLDRFMLKIHVDYPTRDQEITIVKRATTAYHYEGASVLSVEQILAMQELVRKLPVGDHVYEFAVDLVRRSRPAGGKNGGFAGEMLSWGAGPRASIFLLLAAKARALLHGRYHATTQDVVAMALPVLRHRIVPTYNAEASGHTADRIILALIEEMTNPSPAKPGPAPAPKPPPPSREAPPLIRPTRMSSV